MLAIARKLKRKLKQTDRFERCGLILEGGAAIQLPNIHSNPERGFMLDGRAMIEQGSKLIGTWHTHPGATSRLSQEDDHGFRQWPKLTHWIVGSDGVRAYRVVDDIVMEVDLASD